MRCPRQQGRGEDRSHSLLLLNATLAREVIAQSSRVPVSRDTGEDRRSIALTGEPGRLSFIRPILSPTRDVSLVFDCRPFSTGPRRLRRLSRGVAKRGRDSYVDFARCETPRFAAAVSSRIARENDATSGSPEGALGGPFLWCLCGAAEAHKNNGPDRGTVRSPLAGPLCRGFPTLILVHPAQRVTRPPAVATGRKYRRSIA